MVLSFENKPKQGDDGNKLANKWSQRRSCERHLVWFRDLFDTVLWTDEIAS